MTTRELLGKLEGTTYKYTLEHKKTDRKRLEAEGHENAAKSVKASIAGYVQAMRDCGAVTESERQKLFIYYGTV
jgi:hypothetical protein